MARDEAILEAVSQNEAPPTLRFYQWDQATISLGYFQKIAELQEQDEVIRRMPVVRRLTGGGAILHDDELTYSLTLPLNRDLPCTDIKAGYELVHDAYLKAINELGVPAEYRGGKDKCNSQRGPFFCFSRNHCLDLVVGDNKLMGSAQRRVKNGILQHGSLILERHFRQQPSANLNRYASPPLNELCQILSLAISASLGLERQVGQISAGETENTIRLRGKYGLVDWSS
jgi:lipoate-protein ligase A